jgi:hypothetical protein
MVSCNTSSWTARLLLLLLSLTSYGAAVSDHRVVVYYQTTNDFGSSGLHVSLLPLLTNASTISVTNVLLAAFHLEDTDGIHFNDFPPDNPLFDDVWTDVAALQAQGIVVTAMLGGAAAGSFSRLNGDAASFEKYYASLRDFLGAYHIQGLDLDVEESLTLASAVRLIDRLRADFGPDFVITLSPVASALQEGGANLSGFNYFELEAARGRDIAWYNGQFYSGFATSASASDYQDVMDAGWDADRVVMGMLTNSANGGGFVALDTSANTIEQLVAEYPNFGGVAGWEYFNSQPGGTAAPWEWAQWAVESMNATITTDTNSVGFKAKRAAHDAWHVVRRWGRQIWRFIK